MPLAIWTDLGTAFCKVAIWNQNHVDIIPNNNGNHAAPSTIAISETGRLFGQKAQNQITRNLRDAIFDIKRLIGRRFRRLRDELKDLSLEAITATVLAELHWTAEAHLVMIATDAVISVPSRLSDAHRQAAINVGTIARLHNLTVISEASAAAIALVVNRREITDPKTVLLLISAPVLSMSHSSSSISISLKSLPQQETRTWEARTSTTASLTI
ncbi:hypothetical protein BGZ47_011218 [Haplosporangium gracile]|nr:hypothetical protein BGZ47_011218 [Haplosporangium gracile]